MKNAVIDIGSNSVRLMFVADGTVLYKTLSTTRLGEGLSQSGALSEVAVTRTAKAVADFYKKAKDEGASEVVAFATAAVRSSSNPALFLDEVKRLCGLKVQVLSGEKEAEIGILGALGTQDGGIIDIGGASTEITLQKDGKKVYGKSLNVGVVRLKDMCGRNVEELEKVSVQFADMFDEIPKGFEMRIIGGTATTIAAIVLNLEKYDSNKVTGTKITKEQVDSLAKRLAEMSVEEIAMHPCVDKKRADVLLGGVVLLSVIMEKKGILEVFASDQDNLEGFAKTMGLL